MVSLSDFLFFSVHVCDGFVFSVVFCYTCYTTAMASLYSRARSPYWWIAFYDATGKRRCESTGKRLDSVKETREARQLRASKEVAEMNAPASERSTHDLGKWVQPWITSRFAQQANTLESYTLTWNHLKGFLDLKSIRAAEQIRREHCYEYLEHRQRKVCRNTAIHDLVVLRLILNEAVKRGWITQNPAAKLGLKKDTPKLKPEITAQEAAIIEENLRNLPERMQIAWKIAWAQGCRLAETALPLSDVDLKKGLITFTQKGNRRHTTRLHPDLTPLFRKLKREKKTRTWEFSRNASRDWARVFKSLGLPHLTFHSTRVTVITKMARSGKVNEQQAMRFIGHASEQVHLIYQRLKTSDLDSCLEALGAPSLKGKPKKP